jgi:hypothetical protein
MLSTQHNTKFCAIPRIILNNTNDLIAKKYFARKVLYSDLSPTLLDENETTN